MSRWLGLIVVLSVILIPLGLKADESNTVDTTAFATDLYAQLGSQKGNLFFSPTSVETALAMTYAGAKGATAGQMSKALHFGGPDETNGAFGTLLKTLNSPHEVASLDETGQIVHKPAYELMVANALWGQEGYPFNPAFTQVVEKNYGAGLNSVDFGQTEKARKTINDWVATQTKDKIKDLIAKGLLGPATRLVLTNAVYFKSNWEGKFEKSKTTDERFMLSGEQSVDVPMMHQQHGFGYMENDNLQLLELPYSGRELSMIVLLPKGVDGLGAMEKSLTAENLRGWFKETNSNPVIVTLPKFTFSAAFGLSDPLKAMGMTDAFNGDKADFSGMTSAENFFISAVIHKAFVAVDEEGTEAAAATAMVMLGMGAPAKPEEPKVFKADHPFVFLIRHNASGEILFMGRLANPKGE